ncbi:hypothetical protein [Caulobacter segnis]|uniref:hypothetical protein n=1 Tax=Caulobacter segnis TaxID=88688 RepID=UPI00285938BB|nr:hypothetical protein [Caulobacter segnis]MDR6624455.1 hypothetical protein [Caulobacter segnis]
MADLLAQHARLQGENPRVRVLASLDDLGQAGYTSGHCVEAHDLDSVAGHDLSGLSAEVFENGEHRGYLSTTAEFPIRLANLVEHARSVQLAQVCGLLDWEGDGADLVTINRDPDAALEIDREAKVLFQFVPVEHAAATIAAFPNGYFASDLNPMQNYVLAQHLEARYRLALFGVGSRFLGFRRSDPLGEDDACALATELGALYTDTPRGAADALARLVVGRDWLLIRYTAG